MADFGMYPNNTLEMRRWQAERENADARVTLARARECARLLVSQYDPVASLGMDRDKLRVLLAFVWHGDPARLRRECEEVGQ